MLKFIAILSTFLLINTSAVADNNCFLAMENNKIIKEEGSCKKRHSPCSTFKIAISLMGYDAGILIDETTPVFPFKAGYVDKVDSWKQPQNPTTWIKNSCIWYSQLITTKLGLAKFQDYIAKFNYGNQDVSGEKGKNNGLTYSWLSSSLQISPHEQITLLEKLLTNKLPVSLKAQKFTKDLLYIDKFMNDWNLYGKTGAGYLINKDGTPDYSHQIGWFVGWIQKDNQLIIFTQYIEKDRKDTDISASGQAKELAKIKLQQLI